MSVAAVYPSMRSSGRDEGRRFAALSSSARHQGTPNLTTPVAASRHRHHSLTDGMEWLDAQLSRVTAATPPKPSMHSFGTAFPWIPAP